jgi:hypothetical protein
MRRACVIGSISLSMLSPAWCLRGQAPAAQPATMRLCTDGCQTLNWSGDHYDGHVDGQTEVATRYWIKGWADGQIRLFGRTVKPVDGIHQAEGIFTGAINPDGTSIVAGNMFWRVGPQTGNRPYTLSWAKTPSSNAVPVSAPVSVPASAPVVSSQAGPAVGQDDALKAADAWLKLVDSGDSKAAAAGLADETKAKFQGLAPLQNTVSIAALLGPPADDASMNYPNYKFTRTLSPDSVKQVRSCPCGIPSGTFYVMSYDFKSTWNGNVLVDARSHQYRPGGRQGTDVLYMLQEHNGTWKPAWLLWIPKN